MDKRFVIGVDYGSNSVRALVIDVADGTPYGVHVFGYPSGDEGVLTASDNPHVARQNPADFIEGLTTSVTAALKQAEERADFSRDQVVGIGVDTTGSTPIPVDANMTPLAMTERFQGNLNAQAWMWKDHSGMEEAEAITKLAQEHRPQYLAKCGGTYSSEWLFSKIWHCYNADREVFDAAYSWIEFADFVPAVLAGIGRPEDVKASVCAAGHKAMFCDEWGGLPDAEFLAMLAPELGDLRARLSQAAYAAGEVAGVLCEDYASKLGLPAGIAISVGAFDAHLGAVGSGVSKGKMVKILGTSTCDILVAPDSTALPDIPGLCGIVKGSVMPGYYGIEAGQSAVGDIFNWFVKSVCEGDGQVFGELTDKAAALRPGESGLLALDWNNGNRTILVDARLTGLLVGYTLHTPREAIFRALIEATAFGARRILDRIEEYGVPVEEIINCGGIAEKNELFMQIYADVLGRPMRLAASDQTCALGSAMAGAVAAGAAAGGYDRFEDAQSAICAFKETVYEPIAENAAVYEKLYGVYCELHDSFGVVNSTFDHYEVMKSLLAIRESVADSAH